MTRSIFFSLLSVNNGRALNFRYFYFQLAKFFSDAHARPLEEILTSEEDRKFFSDALWRYLIYFFFLGGGCWEPNNNRILKHHFAR